MNHETTVHSEIQRKLRALHAEYEKSKLKKLEEKVDAEKKKIVNVRILLFIFFFVQGKV